MQQLMPGRVRVDRLVKYHGRVGLIILDPEARTG
jgi:hypothetical protein